MEPVEHLPFKCIEISSLPQINMSYTIFLKTNDLVFNFSSFQKELKDVFTFVFAIRKTTAHVQ